MRSEAGQATVDYAALLAVVALVLGAAAALWVDPAGLGGGVTRAFARGICVVRGGACDADLRPCVVASEKTSHEAHLDLVVLKVGRDRYLLRERRSDGTIALTDYHGLRGQAGGRVKSYVRLSGMYEHGSGATYVAGTEAEADRIEGALRDGDGALPKPAETFGETQSRRSYGLSGSVASWTLAGAHFDAGDASGTRVAADGSRTVTFAHASAWGASVLGRSVGAAGESGAAAGEAYAVRLDPAGRPLELVVTATGALDGAPSLPASVAPVAGYLLAPAAANRRYEVEAHLDLGDPGNAAVARDFVAAIGHEQPRIGSVPAPTAALRARIASVGTIEGRAYAVVTAGPGAATGLGPGHGEEVEHARLLAAVSRSYDGAWRSRDDCLEASFGTDPSAKYANIRS